MWKQGQVVQEEYSNTVSECRARGRKTKASPSRGHRWQQEELLSALKEMAGKCRPTTKWGEETSWQRTRNKSGYPMGSSWSLSIRLAFNIFTATTLVQYSRYTPHAYGNWRDESMYLTHHCEFVLDYLWKVRSSGGSSRELRGKIGSAVLKKGETTDWSA